MNILSLKDIVGREMREIYFHPEKKSHIKVNIEISFFRFTRLTSRNMSKCHIIFVVCLKHFLCLKKIRILNSQTHVDTTRLCFSSILSAFLFFFFFFDEGRKESFLRTISWMLLKFYYFWAPMNNLFSLRLPQITLKQYSSIGS